RLLNVRSELRPTRVSQLTLGFFALLVGAGLIFGIPEVTGVGTALGLVNLGVIVSETLRLGRILNDTYDIVAAGLGLRAINGGARRLRTVVGGTLRVIGKVLGRLRPYRLAFAGAVLQVLLSGILELAKPWPLKVVVDNVLGGHPLAFTWLGSMPPRELLIAACLALILVYALLGAFSVSSNYASISVGQRMVNDFRSELYAHLSRLSLAFHSRREVGDLLYRLTSDTFAIQTLTMNGFFPILTSLVLLVGMVVVMVRLDPLLTAASLAVVPFLFLSISRLSIRITTLSTDARVKESAFWSVAQRTMGAIRVIQ